MSIAQIRSQRAMIAQPGTGRSAVLALSAIGPQAPREDITEALDWPDAPYIGAAGGSDPMEDTSGVTLDGSSPVVPEDP